MGNKQFSREPPGHAWPHPLVTLWCTHHNIVPLHFCLLLGQLFAFHFEAATKHRVLNHPPYDNPFFVYRPRSAGSPACPIN